METKVNFIDNLHPNIQLGNMSRPRDPQRWAFMLDAPRPEHGFSVHNNSLNNLLRGLNERVFFTDNNRTPPIAPIKGGFESLGYFLTDFRTTHLREWTLAELVDSYVGSQRTRYSKAAESLAIEPLSKRDSKVATFVKCEKINFSAKTDPAPRVIQPRDPRFNAAIGCFIKPLEKIVYKNLSKLYKFPCVAKGFDVFQTGDILNSKWTMFHNPCAISLDASRFDQHCSVDALKWTHDVYRKYSNNAEFSKLLDMMLVNRGHGLCKDGFVKYEVEGRRMSGDMDTALGNCLLMVAMVYSMCKKLGVRHEVMDNGDDIVIICDRTDEIKVRDEVNSWFTKLGFKMKVEETVYTLEHIEFCQMHPVFDGSRWRMVRNLSSLCKDLVCTTNQEQAALWLQAIGNGGLSLTAGLPVLQEFYSFLRKYGPKGNRTRNNTSKWHLFLSSGFFRMASKVEMGYSAVSNSARESFSKAFSMDFSQQLSLEAMYSSLSPGPLGIDYTAFDCLEKTHCNSNYLFR